MTLYVPSYVLSQNLWKPVPSGPGAPGQWDGYATPQHSIALGTNLIPPLAQSPPIVGRPSDDSQLLPRCARVCHKYLYDSQLPGGGTVHLAGTYNMPYMASDTATEYSFYDLTIDCDLTVVAGVPGIYTPAGPFSANQTPPLCWVPPEAYSASGSLPCGVSPYIIYNSPPTTSGTYVITTTYQQGGWVTTIAPGTIPVSYQVAITWNRLTGQAAAAYTGITLVPVEGEYPQLNGEGTFPIFGFAYSYAVSPFGAVGDGRDTINGMEMFPPGEWTVGAEGSTLKVSW